MQKNFSFWVLNWLKIQYIPVLTLTGWTPNYEMKFQYIQVHFRGFFIKLPVQQELKNQVYLILNIWISTFYSDTLSANPKSRVRNWGFFSYQGCSSRRYGEKNQEKASFNIWYPGWPQKLWAWFSWHFPTFCSCKEHGDGIYTRKTQEWPKVHP